MPDYFTLSEFRQLPDMDDSTQYPDERVEAAAAYIVGVIEREVGTSFIPRTVTDTFDGGGSALVLGPFARSVSAISIGGTPATPGDYLLRSGVLSQSYQRAFAGGWQNISVTYTSGYSATPPADIKEAAMRGTRAYLLETSSRAGVTDRRSSITNEQGTVSYVIAGPDNPTGYPMVDAVIIGWRERLSMYGFA